MVDYNTVQVGQIVYLVSTVGLERCSIAEIDNNKYYVKVNHKEFINTDGLVISRAYGSSSQKATDIFMSLKEAVDCIKHRENERYTTYYNAINNLKDLLEFPIKVSFTDEYGSEDGLVVKAYKTRVKEIIGIDI